MNNEYDRIVETLGLAPTEHPSEFVVTGCVRDADDKPIAGARVLAFDQDLRIPQSLGETVTDEAGEYRIEFTAEHFARAEQARADLFVRALTDKGKLMAQSDVVPAAEAETRLDLTLAATPDRRPELDIVSSAVAPLLEGQGKGGKGICPADLLENDYTFLVRETQLSHDSIVAYVGSAQASRESGMPAELHYAWLRKNLPRDLEALRETPVPTLRAALDEAITDNIVSRAASELFTKSVDSIEHPDRIELQAVLEAAALPGSCRTAVLNTVDDVRMIRDDTIADLVTSKSITEKQANEIGLTTALYRLTGGDLDLAWAAKETKGTGNRDQSLASVRDLVRLNPEDWHDALAATKAKPPKGVDRKTYARELTARTAQLLPNQFLFSRVLAHKSKRGANERKELKLLGAVYDSNPEVDFLALDYHPDSDDIGSIRFTGLKPAEREQALDTLRTIQRTHDVTGNAMDAVALLEAGYDSAFAIASENVEVLAEKTGIPIIDAHAVHAAARDRTNVAGLNWMAIHDAVRDQQVSIRGAVANVPGDFLKRLPGFAELFGSQSYCKCSHCQSVLSPSAYFVDLMKFTEDTATKSAFSGSKQSHPLNLKSRRPDLWTLELTCRNANQVVATLDIVNTVLEDSIAKQLSSGINRKDRAAVEKVVYEKLAGFDGSLGQPFSLPLERLTVYLSHFERTPADVARNFSADPQVVARAQLRMSAATFGLITTAQTGAYLQRLFAVFVPMSLSAVLDPVEISVILRTSGLNRDEFGELIDTEYVQPGSTTKLEVEAQRSSSESVQNDIELVNGLTGDRLDRMQRFVRLWRHVPWTIAELDFVLKTLRRSQISQQLDPTAVLAVARLVDLQHHWDLRLEELLALWTDIPSDPVSEEQSLFDRLFNLPQFRLQDGPWPSTSVFTHPAYNTNPQAGFSSPDANMLHRLAAGLQVSDEQLAQLIEGLQTKLCASPVPATKQFEASAANLTRLYRHARLAKLLDVSIAQLFQLLDLIGKTSVVGLDDLSALREFVDWQSSSAFDPDTIAALVGKPPLRPTNVPDGAKLAVTLVQAVQADLALQFDDAVFARSGRVNDEQSRQLVAANSAPADASPAFVKLAGGTNYRIVQGFDIATGGLEIPNSVVSADVAVADVAAWKQQTRQAMRDLMRQFTPAEVLPTRLANLLAAAPARLEKLAAIASTAVTGQTIEQELWHDPITAPPVMLAALITKLGRVDRLLKSPVFDSDTLDFVAASKATFSLGGDITLESVHRVVNFTSLAVAPDPAFEPDARAPGAADLRYVLTTGVAAVNVDLDRLAAALAAERARVASVLPHAKAAFPPSTDPIGQLRKLADAVGLAEYLGVDGETFKLTLSSSFDELRRAADGFFAAFRTKYPDEDKFAATIEGFEDKLRGRKRNALTDYLLTSPDYRIGLNTDEWIFKTKDEISDHILMDVQIEGCARTSLVVAASASVQRYLQRALMNLEQSRDGKIKVSPQVIPAKEWSWRKNYRVWEANRKVFLFPENYIEPDIRDDKTPQFKQLEDTLLQKQITTENVQQAFTSYVKDFNEVAGLKLCGSFHAKDNVAKRDTLHVVGVDPGDPSTFYYRTVENAYYSELPPVSGPKPRLGWTPWRKIDVQIPGQRVAPAVFKSKLYLLWFEITTTPKSNIVGGSSKFAGYKHRYVMKYTTLKLDGGWTPPQRLALDGLGLTDGDSLWDPLWDSSETSKAQTALNTAAPKLLNMTMAQWAVVVPLWLGLEKKLRDGDFASARSDLVDIVAADTGNKLPMSPVFSALEKMATPAFDPRGGPHWEPRDSYTLKSFAWTDVFPEPSEREFLVGGFNFNEYGWVDFYKRRVAEGPISADPGPTVPPEVSRWLYRRGKSIYDMQNSGGGVGYASGEFSLRSAFIDSDRLSRLQPNWNPTEIEKNTHVAIASLDSWTAEIDVINGSVTDALIDSAGDQMLLQGAVRSAPKYVVRRLGTTLAEQLGRTLFESGTEELLKIDNQILLKEAKLPLSLTANVENKGNAGKLDFTGPFGSYYREIFFHIPFLIANHLNSQQKYAAAQYWYDRIFNPTAPDVAGLRNPSNRVWQYLEFRNLDKIDLPSMRNLLTNDDAINAYKTDPFNPHAIARVRFSAYQKSIVMKYIDNLLDWADSLFTQFTMESVNEATMLYLMAAEILGDRPADVGDCEEDPDPVTYQRVSEQRKSNVAQDFLIELESLDTVRANSTPNQFVYTIAAGTTQNLMVTRSYAMSVAPGYGGGGDSTDGTYGEGGYTLQGGKLSQPFGWDSIPLTLPAANEGTPLSEIKLGGQLSGFAPAPADPPKGGDFGAGTIDGFGGFEIDPKLQNKLLTEPRLQGGVIGPVHRDYDLGGIQLVPTSVVEASASFCVPENKELLAYWDRVEDRLFKVRNCMDITGARRQLALFAPEIDPRMLVRMAAAGVSLDDVLASLSASTPAYRFTYLIEKARQSTATVQALGSQLLAAIERRDAEELNNLRAVHEQNLLKLRTQVQRWEISNAEETLDSLSRQREGVEYRRGFYDRLVSEGLSGWETTQQVSRHVVSGLHTLEATIQLIAAATSLLPQFGAPTAMKYGGLEVSGAAARFAFASQAFGQAAEAASASAGLEATFQRRGAEWAHQAKLAANELKQLDKQIKAAEFRKQIAERSLEVHEKTIEQTEEVFDFYRERFTGLGLFTWMSKQLGDLYREAFNGALEMANAAERACAFEFGTADSPVIRANYWDASKAGLLAADRLMVDLQSLERKYVEQNGRSLEVSQSFSLAQWNPAALHQLKQTGSCAFSIPELCFDLNYPGQYARRIRAVRVSVPCVIGPYTNVGASLTLTGSQIRNEAQTGATFLKPVNLSRADSIAISKAQFDAGVFDFSFRDERFNHFEGAGAVSSWKLALPKNFRPFDYEAISDVILHVDYTAKEDGVFRDAVEAGMAALQNQVLTFFKDVKLYRAFSLRHDFPTEFQQLLRSPKNTEIEFELSGKFLPIFAFGRTTQVTVARLALQPRKGQTTTGFKISINGSNRASFTADDSLGGLPTNDGFHALFIAGMATPLKLAIKDPGPLAPAAAANDDSAVDAAKLFDAVLVLEYRIVK